MKCWNCQHVLETLLVCSRCGMPQLVESASPYAVLDLPPRLRWEEGELEAVHERLARRCHPDLFRAHRDVRVLSAASAAARALNDAFRVLRDPIGRLNYVLAALGHAREATRTVPAGLQESAQIIDRVLTAAEEGPEGADRTVWEAQQDHLASLRVKVEQARERADTEMRAMVAEWDAAVRAARDDWPEMANEWVEKALRWSGEHDYLAALERRMREASRLIVAAVH